MPDAGANAIDVIDAVLQADDGRCGIEMLGEQARGGFVVGGLDREQDQRRAAHGTWIVGRLDGHVFGEVDTFKQQTVASDGRGVRGPADERDGCARACEHRSEVAADRACAKDGDARPFSGIAGSQASMISVRSIHVKLR